MSRYFSPDGLSIVFTSERDGNKEIYSYDFETKKISNLTKNGGNDWNARFFYENKKIIFQSTRDGNWEIYRMNFDGTDQVNLTNHPSTDYSFVVLLINQKINKFKNSIHVFIIAQYFPPETGALASRWGDFSKILVDQKHKVTVLCESPHYPNDDYYTGYKNSFLSIDKINPNLTILRTKAFASDRKSTFKKLCHYFVFMISAILNTGKVKNYDL